MWRQIEALLLRPVAGQWLGNRPLPLSDRLRPVCSAGGRAGTDTRVSLPASRAAGVVRGNGLEPHTRWKVGCPRAPLADAD